MVADKADCVFKGRIVIDVSASIVFLVFFSPNLQLSLPDVLNIMDGDQDVLSEMNTIASITCPYPRPNARCSIEPE